MAESLSPLARERMVAGLPRLLAAVRTRRRRRHGVRAVAALIVCGVAVAAWQWPRGAEVVPVPPRAPRWVTVQDDATIVARCTVPSVRRDEWFIGDDDLQDLLREADRPDGLVRVRGEVLVSSAAVDPFPEFAP